MGKTSWIDRAAEQARDIEQQATLAATRATSGTDRDNAETVLRLSRGLRRRLEHWAQRSDG